MVTVTFCGHRDVHLQGQILDKLDDIIESLIRNGADRFLLGGYGQFDIMAAEIVHKKKQRYSDIEAVLVVPYLDRRYDVKCYDYTLYPPLESVPRQFAILKRNEYMVDLADIVVACVEHDWGGAAQMLEYAQKNGKTIISLI